MQNYWRAVRSFNHSIRVYFAMWSLLALANFGLIGVLQNLYLLRLGFDVDSIGLLIGSGQLMWALGALPGAAIGRRMGTKRSLMLGIVMNLVAFTFFFAVEAVPRQIWPLWLWFWNTINWIGSAIFVVNSTPYLTGITKPSERGYVFAVQAAIFPLFSFVGSLVAGLLPEFFAAISGATLDQPAPYRNGLLLVPVIYVFMTFIFSRARDVEADAGEATSQPISHSTTAPIVTLLIFGLIGVLQSIGDGVIMSFFNIFLDRGLGLLPAQIGALIGIASLLPIVGALLSAPLMKRIGSGATFGLSAAGLGASLGVMALMPTLVAAAIGRMVSGTMLSIAGAARNLFSQEIVDENWRTQSSAVSTIGLASGWTIAAFAGGFLIRESGFGVLFSISGVLAAASAVLTFAYVRLRKPHQTPPPPPPDLAPVLKDSPSL